MKGLRFDKLIPQVWSALMLLCNHNDSAIRMKSIKSTATLLKTFSLPEELEAKIYKCLENRLMDPSDKIRQMSLSAIMLMPHYSLSSITGSIRKEFGLPPFHKASVRIR